MQLLMTLSECSVANWWRFPFADPFPTAIGLRHNFVLAQTLLTVPSILMILVFKLYIKRAYLRHFRYFIPRPEDLPSVGSHPGNASLMNGKLSRRFGHPVEHVELFRPMLHQKMMPLLKEVYTGRIEDEEAHREFIPRQTSQGSGLSNNGGVKYSVPAPASPSLVFRNIPPSPGGLSREVMTQVLYDVVFQGVDQVKSNLYPTRFPI
jgi:hypothetical protein